MTREDCGGSGQLQTRGGVAPQGAASCAVQGMLASPTPKLSCAGAAGGAGLSLAGCCWTKWLSSLAAGRAWASMPPSCLPR